MPANDSNIFLDMDIIGEHLPKRSHSAFLDIKQRTAELHQPHTTETIKSYVDTSLAVPSEALEIVSDAGTASFSVIFRESMTVENLQPQIPTKSDQKNLGITSNKKNLDYKQPTPRQTLTSHPAPLLPPPISAMRRRADEKEKQILHRKNKNKRLI